jgi:hypothetical protein
VLGDENKFTVNVPLVLSKFAWHYRIIGLLKNTYIQFMNISIRTEAPYDKYYEIKNVVIFCEKCA